MFIFLLPVSCCLFKLVYLLSRCVVYAQRWKSNHKPNISLCFNLMSVKTFNFALQLQRLLGRDSCLSVAISMKVVLIKLINRKHRITQNKKIFPLINCRALHELPQLEVKPQQARTKLLLNNWKTALVCENNLEER